MGLSKKSYPLFYYSRGSDARNKERCDLIFVMQRMKLIPDELKEEVSNTYDNMMLSSNGADREKANRYLDGIAQQYRKESPNSAADSVLERVNSLANAPKQAVFASKLKTDTKTSINQDKPIKRGFLDKLLDDVDREYKK